MHGQPRVRFTGVYITRQLRRCRLEESYSYTIDVTLVLEVDHEWGNRHSQ